MASVIGSSIVDDGLVFHYDMDNAEKSWKGAPTTNFISNPTEEMARGEFGQYRNLAPIFDTYGLVPYSLSMDIKVNKPGSVRVYMQNGSSTKYNFVYQSVSATTEYQRFYFNNITPAISTPTDTAATLATYTTYGSGVTPTVKNIQLELGAFASPFVNGTRANTQSILDLTRQNTITANSLTYNSNGSFSFNGISDYATVSYNFENSFHGVFSFDMWINGASFAATSMPWSVLSGVGYSECLIIDSTPNVVFGTKNSTNTIISASTVITPNQWYYIAGTCDWNALQIKIYKNGVLSETTSITGIRRTDSSSIIIGRRADGGNQYNGSISKLSFYNRVLSVQEIQQNFEAHRRRYGI